MNSRPTPLLMPRRRTLHATPVTYTYRNLPLPLEDNAFCVTGEDSNGGTGVLEWCTSEEDAKQMLKQMRTFPQFSNLKVENMKIDDAYEDDFDPSEAFACLYG